MGRCRWAAEARLMTVDDGEPAEARLMTADDGEPAEARLMVPELRLPPSFG